MEIFGILWKSLESFGKSLSNFGKFWKKLTNFYGLFRLLMTHIDNKFHSSFGSPRANLRRTSAGAPAQVPGGIAGGGDEKQTLSQKRSSEEKK